VWEEGAPPPNNCACAVGRLSRGSLGVRGRTTADRLHGAAAMEEPGRSTAARRRRRSAAGSGAMAACRVPVSEAIRRAMEALPTVEPMPPTADLTLPWDAPTSGDPVTALADPRPPHGGRFVVGSGR